MKKKRSLIGLMVSNLMQGHFNDVQPTISRFSTVLVIKPYFLHVYQEMDIFHQLYPNNLDMVIGMYVVVLYCSRMMTLLSKNIGACCFRNEKLHKKTYIYYSF